MTSRFTLTLQSSVSGLPGPVQVSVAVVEEVGRIVILPDVPDTPEMPVAEQFVALVLLHVTVVVSPSLIEDGEKLQCAMTSGSTVMVSEVVAGLPRPVQVSLTVVVEVGYIVMLPEVPDTPGIPVAEQFVAFALLHV